MDKLLHQLGELVLTALPTCLIVGFLTIYLKYIFFQPLEKVLHQRYEATEGARKLAEESLKRAAVKTAEYEAKLRAARSEIYQAQAQAFKQLQDQTSEEIAHARSRSSAAVQAAKRDLAQDVEAAKATLAKDSDALANQIADTMLRRRAA
jgi:F-type H+-transporting ATPase subunit b